MRQAERPGDECVQQAIFWRPGSAASWREDCLYLNVYAPPSEPDVKHLVLVWFHGGGWINGAGTDVQPTWLVGEGNVVVTVNYRLGAFGLPIAADARRRSPPTTNPAANTAISTRSTRYDGSETTSPPLVETQRG